jgi:hypothetical protein
MNTEFYRKRRRERAANNAFFHAWKRLREAGSPQCDDGANGVDETGAHPHAGPARPLSGGLSPRHDETGTKGGRE